MIIGIYGGSLCDFKAFSTNISATTTEQGLVMAAGVGASLPVWAYQMAAKTFACDSDSGQRIKYTPTGSGDGIKSILKNHIDFAGTDVLIKNSTYVTYETNAEDVLLIPS